MGDIISKSARTTCIDTNVHQVVPKYHFKCRFHADDELCFTDVYTRTKDIIRFPVPLNKINWLAPYDDYSPKEFTSEKILLKDGKTYKDPHISEPEYKAILFNKVDHIYNCDRQSHHGDYHFIQYKADSHYLAPRNPVGRTGLIGRGHLGRWGCNHAADPIVTTWKRNEKGEIVKNPKTYKPILKFVAIQRRDTKEWAIPGGMRDPGEVITKTLVREFAEEALSHNLFYDESDQIDVKKGEIEEKLNKFFRNGTEIYKGYVDDPRNTDNAWMETIACNFHDDKGDLVGSLLLQGGDDAEKAVWMDLDSNLKLFASHVDFLHKVATLHKAHW